MSSQTPYHAHDVLCGRGKKVYEHPGNQAYRSMIKLNKILYSSSKRSEKLNVSKLIIQSIKSLDPPGRFLEFDSFKKEWVEISDQKAIEKTSQALRERRSTYDDRTQIDFYPINFINNADGVTPQELIRNKIKQFFPNDAQRMNDLNICSRNIQITSSNKMEEFEYEDKKKPALQQENILTEKDGMSKKDVSQIPYNMRSCLLFEKSLYESCRDIGMEIEELDALIFQVFKNEQS